MEFCYDAMFCSTLGTESFYTGHIKWSRGPQAPRPWPTLYHCEFIQVDNKRLEGK